MSGGGGGGGFTFDNSTDCESLSIRTHIASPIPAVIAKIKVGDNLSVDLTPPTGPVEVVTEDGETAGSLLPPDIAKLIQCISQGHVYRAKVTSISGGNCQVLITHA
jgi:hypothetical protein